MPKADAPPPEMVVTLYSDRYLPEARVGDYESCSVTWQHLGVGTGTLVLELDHPQTGRFLRARNRVVPVTVEVAERRWSGRAVHVQRQTQEDGGGNVSVTLVDDWAWLRAILAFPVPTAALNAQTAAHDVRTGRAVTVACQLIQANADRLRLPLVVATPADDTSPTVTVRARMRPVSEYVIPLLQAADWSLDVSVWLPGDRPVLGLDLSRPTVVVRPYRVGGKPWLEWSDEVGGVVSSTVSVQHPDAYGQVLGGAGELELRVFASYVDEGLRADLGPFGFPESFADETQATTVTELLAEGPKHQADSAGSAAVSIDVIDGLPWTFGEHYEAGDLPTISLAGETFTDRITRVTASDNRDSGLLFTPQVGDAALAESAEVAIIRTVAGIAERLAAVQAGR